MVKVIFNCEDIEERPRLLTEIPSPLPFDNSFKIDSELLTLR